MEHTYLFNRIGYVYAPTSDIDASIEWYTTHLALKLMNKFEDRGSYLAVLHHAHKHSIALVLIETKDRHRLEIARNGRPFPIMAIQCSNIEQTYETLKQKGVEVDTLETLGTGEAKYFYFRDDQGNLLEAAWSIWDPEDEFKEDFVPGS
ncbi:hypothetical protein XYCOK13_24360 [Xylanibacillus composti]|uniref:VOC domain-containing protein n=1 Tax=Xylanibacillus composti TaxID=1572762 RepID=A0A8J4H4Z7_9BACL|nr:VOC family protein [Xylanibacillus composti]GIQ69612.1 hypothetical protein XYCOK13_24360 [Xylanibacillus composti]